MPKNLFSNRTFHEHVDCLNILNKGHGSDLPYVPVPLLVESGMAWRPFLVPIAGICPADAVFSVTLRT